MTTKTTIGPWHTGGHGNRTVYAADGYAVANAIVYHGQPTHAAEAAANARLIAAAPELLAALQNARNVLAAMATGDLKTIKKDSPALAEARAAIAKATGGE